MATTKRTAKNKDRPFAAAAAVGGAVAAGVFLWSRRNQISSELGRLGEQIGEWRDSLQSDNGRDESSDGTGAFIAKAAKAKRGKGKQSQAEIVEEALTLKASGATANRPADPVVEDQLKVGAVAY